MGREPGVGQENIDGETKKKWGKHERKEFRGKGDLGSRKTEGDVVVSRAGSGTDCRLWKEGGKGEGKLNQRGKRRPEGSFIFDTL